MIWWQVPKPIFSQSVKKYISQRMWDKMFMKMVPEAELILCILLLLNSFNGDEFQLSYIDN